MNPDKFTDKTNEALVKAQELARDHSHIQMSPLHVAVALIQDRDGLLRQVLGKLNLQQQPFERSFMSKLVKLPSQSPPPDDIGASSALMQCLRSAQDMQKKNGDSHLAVDHLLLALYNDKDVSNAFSENGLPKDKLEATLKTVRGNRKVSTPSLLLFFMSCSSLSRSSFATLSF